jgi:hypothetical protein
LGYGGFEVLTAVVMKNAIFWDIVLWIPLKVNKHFRGMCHLPFQGQRISLGLCFDTEDRREMLLWNAGWLPADYIALYPRRQNFKLGLSSCWWWCSCQLFWAACRNNGCKGRTPLSSTVVRFI